MIIVENLCNNSTLCKYPWSDKDDSSSNEILHRGSRRLLPLWGPRGRAPDARLADRSATCLGRFKFSSSFKEGKAQF
ncbi:hypothetical protein L6452_19736 [Arctium lappa]|uniref:Uncharacterized protein n=1 Tax=Arctium lappa TaxID=4217 RepID=A0ACB9B9E4_ARCLA|nr:hypothetical protein L6452_19736 [Arctium lappa]